MFRHLSALSCAAFFGFVSVTVADDATEPGFVALFDGETLRGWNGDDRWFRVVDGVIVAGSESEPIPHNYFLCTDETFGDFELRLDIKLIGEGENAGVQFRSRREAGSTEVIGYQADAGRAWDRWVWGALYDESRRRRMLAEPDHEQLKGLVRPDDWNQMTVIARGPQIEIRLNGETTVTFEETEEVAKRGVIGLQIHSGPPTRALYRNVRLRRLGSDAGER